MVLFMGLIDFYGFVGNEKMKKNAISLMNVLFLVLLIAACKSEPKGLDRVLDTSDMKKFGETCMQALGEIQEVNPKEFKALRDIGGFPVYDLTQPREKMYFLQNAPYSCSMFLKVFGEAIVEDNVELSSVREAFSYMEKSSIDSGLRSYNSLVKGESGFCNKKLIFDERRCAKEIRKQVDDIKKNQAGYRVLTGQSYGPEDLAAPAE